LAEATAGRRGLVLPRSRVEAKEWVLANLDILALVGLMVLAAAFRFWDLGGRALHHDESLHAQFSWYLYQGRGYVHDPMMHGTFLFHANALIYFLFGATDYTARIVPALFGVALVGMPFFLRKQIGMRAVLIAAVLLAFSPTLLYFGRFVRNDIYVAVFTFAIVICVWRYLDEQRPTFLYVMAFFAALSFGTKEVTFITLAILILFVNFMLAHELGRRREDEEVKDRAVFARTAALLPVAWVVAALWPLISRKPFGRETLPPAGDVLIILGTFTLPQFAPAIQVIPASFGERLGSVFDLVPLVGEAFGDTARRVFVGNQGYRVAAEDDMRIISVLVLLIVTAYIGLLWRPRVWLIAAAAFFIPYVLLFTTFFSNTPPPWSSDFWAGQGGFWSGIWGSLDYWLDQHDVKRGDQPGYYYALLTPLYEFLPLLLTLGGAVWLLIKGNSFTRWLLFWIAGIFIGLSMAGEKMPWLETHIALPLTIAAALVLNRALDWLGFSTQNWTRPVAVAGVAALAVLLLVAADSPAVTTVGWLLAGLALAAVVALGWRFRNGEAGRLALVVSLAALFVLTVRAGTMASFKHGDIPVEMLVYTQTSPDIPAIRDRIDAISRETRLGRNLPIVVDAVDGFSWPWAWYLRDYQAVQYVAITPEYEPPEGAVLLVGLANARLIDESGYSLTPYKHRWWFLETYRNLTVSRVASILTSWDGLRGLGDFFINRRPVSATGSVDGVAFFPGEAQEAPEPLIVHDGRIAVGGPGRGPGLMIQPAGLFVDGQGRIWVADSGNDRLQMFDSAGNHIAVIGRTGERPVTFNQPWSLAVDEEGFIFVADTWGHGIRKLSPAFELLLEWGVPGGRPDPGPFDLFGPRDIAIAPDGTLWVTDTGHKRIVQYSRDGEALAVFGAGGSDVGQFDEQVGLVFDAEGNLYVADSWNGRIQKFGPGFRPLAQYEVGWASTEVAAKPYIAVLADGRLLTADPAQGILILFDGDGRRVGAWKPEANSYPVGVAAMTDGGFVYSDYKAGQIQIVPARLIDSLFR
jgi:predicted membrane-bound mannosyltransferase/sugar lactone lactonase YvrE